MSLGRHVAPRAACTLRSRGQRPRRQLRLRAQCSAAELHPQQQQVRAFAPATIANLGVGFDWLGCAVGDKNDSAAGDIVTATALPGQPGKVVIERIMGDGGRLPLEAAENCVGIAALEALEMIKASHGSPTCGVSLVLEKGLPLGSGLGSSAASAAAGAWAVNGLFGCPVPKEQLVYAGLKAEAAVSGYHADNIAPALLGAFTLVRSTKPLDLERLESGGPLWFVLVNPKFEAPTAEMRAVLPKMIPMASQIHNAAMGGSLIAGILRGDAAMLGHALDSDIIVEPVRGKLIPGFSAVKAAAKAGGAYGCTISGAGPTCVAVVANAQVGQRVAEMMADAFQKEGGLDVNFVKVVQVNNAGTELI